MEINPNILGNETDEIISVFIDYITRSEDKEEKEKETGRRKTDLKIFLAENDGFELGTLEQTLTELLESKSLDQYIDEFVVEHNFSEELLNEEVSYVEIRTPKAARTDQFIFIDDGDYLRVLTAERRDWTKKTVEKLLDYLPNLERLYLSSDDIKDIVEDLEKTSISGFTAKYHSYASEKKASIRFHGGTEEDLDDVEDVFDAKPTRLEFDQRNSPAAAINSAVAQEGFISFSSVRSGSEEKGAETLKELSEDYEEHDRKNFRINFSPSRIPIKDGYTIDGVTTLKLIDEADSATDKDTAPNLEENILSKRRYEYSTWEPGNYTIFDKEHGEPFEITIEGNDIFLHAKEATTSNSFRDFFTVIQEEFNTTYTLEKDAKRVRA